MHNCDYTKKKKKQPNELCTFNGWNELLCDLYLKNGTLSGGTTYPTFPVWTVPLAVQRVD